MMTSLMANWMIAAATLVVAAGSAPAQDLLKADIPFTFRAGTALMQPGSYEVRTASSASRYLIFRNTDTHESVIVAHYVAGEPSKEWRIGGIPKMAFDCAGSRCVLREIWSGSDAATYFFPHPRVGRDDAPRIAEIRMSPIKAD